MINNNKLKKIYNFKFIHLITSIIFITFSCKRNIPYKIKFHCEGKIHNQDLSIFFEESFKEDTISIFIDDELFYNKIITTDPSLSLASSVDIVNFYKKKEIFIIINKNKIKISPKRVCGKVLIINYIHDTLYFEFKDKPNLYY